MNYSDIMNSECIHCNVYFLNRSSLINRKKMICRNKIINLYPINYKCTNPYCNTTRCIMKKMEKSEDKMDLQQENKMEIDEQFNGYDSDSEFEPGANYDNWDIEPKTKIFRKTKRKNDTELQNLFKNLKISKIMKKRKKMKQLKMTDYDISNIISKLSL